MMLDATNIIDYTYDSFREGIDSIASQVQASNFLPHYIVGIVRGGAVPGVYLSHKLKIPVVMVSWNTRDNTEIGNESNSWIPEDICDGKRVLLIDDIVDGGDTIKELLADWGTSVHDDLNMNNLRIAAMWYNITQDINVDFYHKTIDRDVDQRWVIFPWEA